MTAPTQQRARRLQMITLVVTVGLAAALGGIMWVSLTSLPYLATSPTTDPTFGALNACLLESVRERVGFSVSLDATRAAAWSASQLTECSGTPAVATTYPLSGVTLGAYDGQGALWISTSSAVDAGTGRLQRLEDGGFVSRGEFGTTALVGIPSGVVALDRAGQLMSLKFDGALSATRTLPLDRQVHLAANDEGTLVALWGGGRFAVVNSGTLESTPAEAPCAVRHVWWRPQTPLMLVDCVELVLEVNALNAQSALEPPRQREPSTLVGRTGIYVQGCDQLPCSAPAPR